MKKNAFRSPKKPSTPPGTLVYVGSHPDEKVEVRVFDYTKDFVQEKVCKTPEECAGFASSPSVSWIDVSGVNRIEIVEGIGKAFGIHALVLEDIVNTHQRPKMENYGKYIYLVLKMMTWNEAAKQIDVEQVSIVLGASHVISFQEIPGDVFDPIRHRLHAAESKLRHSGADYLAYALFDSIVDHYFVILERLGDEIIVLEETIQDHPEQRHLRRLHRLKREIILLRKNIWPLREVSSGLQRAESGLIHADTVLYLKDVYDHTIHVLDTIESYQEMLTGMLDLYLSSQSARLNEIMKVLTIIATVFTPPTFVASVYGMNFRYMPELDWRWGYFTVLFTMFLMIAGMLYYFRRKRWLSAIFRRRNRRDTDDPPLRY